MSLTEQETIDPFDDDLDDEDLLALEDAVESGSIKRPLEDGSAAEPPAKRVAKGNYIALARRILRTNFNYQAFRHEQEQAIANVLAGKNTLVVFPTGAGKSLCYQIPAIAFPELDAMGGGSQTRDGGHGLTIVVSPLIALMKDQVDALRRRGIKADCMDSTKSYEQTVEIKRLISEGQLRLLYCAPERLNNEAFVASIKHVPGGIRLVAVDEAHCVSEWGHSFRPDYLKVARFTQEIKAERVVCLTATATPKVALDICAAFNIDSKTSLYRTPPYRPNLQLFAQAAADAKAKRGPLLDFLKGHKGPTIVYATTQKQVEQLAAYLESKKFNAAAFHAGMKTEDKTRIQDAFMASEIDIVVATIAFGMGIDKADIRNIVHFDLPGTIEEYSQQIGRAGRDGKPSTCMFFISGHDFYLRESFARGDLPSKGSLKGLLRDIFKPEVVALTVDSVFGADHLQQTKEFDIRMDPLRVIYAILELRYGLIRAIQPEYKEYSFSVPSPRKYKSLTTRDTSLEAKAIVSMSKLARTRYSFDLNSACSSFGLMRGDVLRKLDYLHDTGVIDLRMGGVQPRYRILKKLPATKEDTDALAEKLFQELQLREEDSLKKTQEMSDLITGSKCFSLALAQHFGMELPDGKTSCQHCSYCKTQTPIVLPKVPPRPVDWGTVGSVLAACDVRDDPRCLTRFAFGIKSPRIMQKKLHQSKSFMSMADYSFGTLLAVFTAECKKHGYEGE